MHVFATAIQSYFDRLCLHVMQMCIVKAHTFGASCFQSFANPQRVCVCA